MRFHHILIALVVPMTWGFGFAFAKAGLDHFPPLLLMGIRFLLAGLILVWFVPIPRGFLLRIFGISFVAATLQYGLTFSGLARMDATPAILLVQSEVLFGVIIAAVLLGEKPSLRQIVGMIIACFGIIAIAGAPTLAGQMVGIALLFGGTLTWAFGQVLIRSLNGAVGGFQLTAWMGMMAGPQMLTASLLIDGDPLPVIAAAPPIAWATIAYLAVVMTVIGYSAWYYVLARYPVPLVMPVLLLLPVSTILGAVTFLGEQPDPTVLLSGLVVIFGVAVVIVEPSMFRRRVQQPAAPASVEFKSRRPRA